MCTGEAMMGFKISVTIITLNEESNIKRCLESVSWADDIVIVDSGSTDKTVEICRQFDCRILDTAWMGFGRTKQFAVEQAAHDWIFSIDSDEVITPELQAEIKTLLEEEPPFHGYRVPRRSTYLNKIILHGGWQRDRPLRLFNRQYAAFNKKEVHESVAVDGDVDSLQNYLLHYPYPDITTHLSKMNTYTELGAEELFEKGRTCSLFEARMRGLIKFFKMYFLQGGFLDGAPGYVLAKNSAFGVYLKYVKLWQKNR